MILEGHGMEEDPVVHGGVIFESAGIDSPVDIPAGGESLVLLQP